MRDQCTAAGVPFLFKQWGAWLPGEQPDPLSWAKWQDGEFGHRFDFRPGVENMVAWDSDGSPHYSVSTPDEQEAFRTAHGRPSALSLKIGKKRAGRELDGRTWDEMPA